MTYDEALTFVWRICSARREAQSEFERNNSPESRKNYYALTNMREDALELTAMAFDKTRSDVMYDVQFRKSWK